MKYFIYLILVLLPSKTANATAGFAEWQVITPGGNLIRHVDGWKEEHGDCITADDHDTNISAEEKRKVYVSHLKRWKYYEGFIVGENKNGFFIFNESNKSLERFNSEEQLYKNSSAELSKNLTDWLTGGDGHFEAWLPFFSWRPCKIKLGELKATPEESESLSRHGPSISECKKTFTEKQLALYRRTTWGRSCRKMTAELNANAKDPRAQMMLSFCKELLQEKKSK